MKKLVLEKRDGFVSVDAKDLVEAVKALKVFASKWDVLQLTVSNETLFVDCVGETNSLRVAIPCIPSPDFPEVCCATLQDFSDCLPKSGQVNLQVTSGVLILDTATLRFGICLWNAEIKEFSFVASPLFNRTFISNFWEALDFVIPAMSNDDECPRLQGVLIDDDKLVATDGHRLHVVDKVEVGFRHSNVIDQLFVPSLAANVLQKVQGEELIISKKGQTLQFNIFRRGRVVLCLKVKDPGVEFPDYKLCIPDRYSYTSKVTLNGNSKKQLISLRKAVLKEQEQDYGYEKGAIKLHMEEHNGVVGSTWKGETITELSTVKSGILSNVVGGIVVGVNSKYLIDAFGNEKSITVCFDKDTPGDSPMFVDFEDPNKFALIMPVRTN